MNFTDWLDEQMEKHPLRMCILIPTFIVTIIGLALILPVGIAIKLHSLWPLFLYLPIVGAGAGIIAYMEMY